jgi:riboflavin biosynthesis pyrimidine reductase
MSATGLAGPAGPGDRLVTLYERDPPTRPRLTEPLRDLYGGDLDWPLPPERPYVIANFVETLDGVVSFGLPGRSGGDEISASSAADRFVMGLLRACADAVVFASGTLHGDSGHVRTAAVIHPESAELYAALRAEVSPRRTEPLNVIVTGSGGVDLGEATFRTPGRETLIVSGEAGVRRLRADHGEGLRATQVRAVVEAKTVPPAAVTRLLHEEWGVRLLLHEGGPTLLGSFLAARLVDELFLTVAPQVAGRAAAGRDGPPRPGLAEGAAFLPESAPWFGLETVKRAGDHLFLRLGHRARR